MDEPIDVEFKEIGSSNLPALRSTVPQTETNHKQFDDDRNKYPIENHLWALQNDRLMCLGGIASYHHQPGYQEPLNVPGYAFVFKGRHHPAEMRLSLLCNDDHLRNICKVRDMLCSDDIFNTSRDQYLIHIMGSIVSDMWGVPHGFLMRDMLMTDYEMSFSGTETPVRTDIIFTEAGGPSINFYDFDTETHELNQTHTIQPPKQKLLR